MGAIWYALTFRVAYFFATNWPLEICRVYVWTIFGRNVSNIMDNLLGETITIFNNPVVRIINPFVVKWVVCNSKVLFASVLHILQVTVKVFLLGSHRIGCQLSLGLSLSFNFLVTWGLLLKTSQAFLYNWVWPQLPQARCLLNLLLLLHRLDNRSKLD